MSGVDWEIEPADPRRCDAFAGVLGIHPLTAQLLINRGVDDPHTAQRFLEPRLASLEDPTSVPDLARGVDRLRDAIKRSEPIVLFGDSDVDGLTATRILYEALDRAGGLVRAICANRIRDGYGLPETALDELCRSSAKLVILVDCGTNQPEAIEQLARCGIETIIVDHHVPLARRAQPLALINPHADSGDSREALGLCSAGLALKIVHALLQQDARDESLAESLDLAALGTVADCAPLIGDNRIIVAEGLPRLLSSPRIGLRRLCEATQTKTAEPEQLSRRLIPRLNASGRLGEATAIWHLLDREMPLRCEEWLAQADTAHATTQQWYRRLIAQAQEQAGRFHFRDELVMVVSGEGWPAGLMGPLASQLVARYGRPAIAIALNDQRGVGSGRSIPSVNLWEVIQASGRWLVRWGGHAQACGLTLERKHLRPFHTLVNEQAARLIDRHRLIKRRRVDIELPLRAVQSAWVSELARLAPFGYGNPRPTVAILGVHVERHSPRTGVVSDGTVSLAAKGHALAATPTGRYDVVATPTLSEGMVTLSLSDVRPVPRCI